MWPEFLGMSMGLNLDAMALQSEPFDWHSTATEDLGSDYLVNERLNAGKLHHLSS